MAQRVSPARRIPENPLAGILRAVRQQARYSQRRRSSNVPTVTSQDVASSATLETTDDDEAEPALQAGAPGVALGFEQLALPFE